MHADKIVVFRKGEDGCGEIAEEGRHDGLLKRNGAYAVLWRNSIGETEQKAEERTVEELFEI
jgi:ABC-type multidrug transport system fused ATPase/permease subunit